MAFLGCIPDRSEPAEQKEMLPAQGASVGKQKPEHRSFQRVADSDASKIN